MKELSVHDVLPVLCAAREVSLRGRDGAELPVSVERIEGSTLFATAPRFRVTLGIEVTGRVVDPRGEPWSVRLRLDRAEVIDQDTARIELRVVAVEQDDQRRLDPRTPAGGAVLLVAVNCQEVVDGDRITGRLVDVSASGVAITCDRVLRRGDRLAFQGRFFTEAIDAEVRVVSIRGADTGRRIYGCRFLEMDVDSRDRLTRVLSGDRPQVASIDVGALRDLMADAAPSGRWRKRLRRSA